MLIVLLAFVTGALSGYFVEIKTDEYRDAKLERLEQMMMDESSDDYYFHESQNGEIWAIQAGRCIQVF